MVHRDERCVAVGREREGGGAVFRWRSGRFCKEPPEGGVPATLALEWIVGPEPSEIGVNLGEAHVLVPGN